MAARTRTLKPGDTVDYTKHELGTVLRTYRGRNTVVVARCPKCSRLGARSSSIPEPSEVHHRPYVSVTHTAKIETSPIGGTWQHVSDNCSVRIDRTNVDDLLNVEERARYDAWLDAVRAWTSDYLEVTV